MSKNIGFLLPSLNSEQHAAIITHISKLINHNRDKNIIIFSNTPKVVIPNNIPVLSIKESKYFKGKLFVFDLLSALIATKFATQEKYFWVGQAIFWQNQPYENFHVFKTIFDQEDMSLIVQNQQVSDIYEICYKKPKYILEEFSHEKLQAII